MDRAEIQKLVSELEAAAAGHRSAARRHRRRAQRADRAARLAEGLARVAEVQLAGLRHDLGHPPAARNPDLVLTCAGECIGAIELKGDPPRRLTAKAAINEALRRNPDGVWSPRTLAIYVLQTESVAITPANIQMHLRRMLDRGEVERVKHGWYRPSGGPTAARARMKRRTAAASGRPSSGGGVSP